MSKWIPFPHREGTCSKQAHADFPKEAIYEREAGRSGFFGPAAHFHHQHAPTGWSEWEAICVLEPLILAVLKPPARHLLGKYHTCYTTPIARYGFGESIAIWIT